MKKLNGVVVCLDNGRYVNHSDTPNMGAVVALEKSTDAWQASYTNRDIQKGEELTESYTLYDNAPKWNETCKMCHVFYDAVCC